MANIEAAATALFKELLEMRKRVRGQDHPDTLKSMDNLDNLAGTYQKWSWYKEAEALFKEVLEMRKKV